MTLLPRQCQGRLKISVTCVPLLDVSPRRPYRFCMPQARSLSFRAALAVALVLCLVTIPLCSVRCGACAVPSSAATNSCHESSGPHSGWNASTNRSCATPDLLFTVSNGRDNSVSAKSPESLSVAAVEPTKSPRAVNALTMERAFALSPATARSLFPPIPLRL